MNKQMNHLFVCIIDPEHHVGRITQMWTSLTYVVCAIHALMVSSCVGMLSLEWDKRHWNKRSTSPFPGIAK